MVSTFTNKGYFSGILLLDNALSSTDGMLKVNDIFVKKKKKSFNLVVLSEQCICERNFLHCALKFLMYKVLDVGGKK